MSNPNKDIGTGYETDVKDYLGSVGLRPKRTGSAEAGQGDIHAGAWTIECKNEKTINLPGYLKQLAAAVERRGAFPYFSAVWVKNRRHGVKDSYAVMSGENYRSLMVYVESLEQAYAEIVGAVLEYEREGQQGDQHG